MEGWRTLHIDWNQASQGHVQKLTTSALMMLVMKMEPRHHARKESFYSQLPYMKARISQSFLTRVSVFCN